LTIMFCSTVSRRARRETWKLRPMPYAAIRSGRPRGARRSSRRTVPLSGSWMPETTLISVDLPEPLGPTIPTMLPGAAVMLTPPRARKPPKETLMSAIVNTVELPGFGDEALGPIEEDQHQDQAEARQPQIGDEVRGQIGPLRDEAGRYIGELDHDGAEDDPEIRAWPAEDNGRPDDEGLDHHEGAGRDIAGDMGIEDARRPGHG